MAALYPLNFIATWSLVSIAYVNSNFYHDGIFFAAATSLEALSGAFNVITYALQSRFGLRHRRCSVERQTDGPSGNPQTFRVDIRPVQAEDISFVEAFDFESLRDADTRESLVLHTQSHMENLTSSDKPMGSCNEITPHTWYRIVTPTVVFKAPSVHSERIADMAVDTRVQVVGVSADMESQRFWCKISEPSGWLTLRTLDY